MTKENENNSQIIGTIKNIIKSKNNVAKKTKIDFPFYECINKIENLDCKGNRSDRKGTGFVLQEGEKCFDCQFDTVP